MREPIGWLDHVVEYPGRFKETNLGNNLVQHEASPGEIKQQGTPMNAANFNDMDLAAFEAAQMGAWAEVIAGWIQRNIDSVLGTDIDITLANKQSYPFNNSKKTVALPATRSNDKYYVYPEVLESQGGAVGDIEISDKLLNGFKIAFTGSAGSVTLRCHVVGGM